MSETSQQFIIVIAGPTASGKTAVSVELARIMGGAVISADSQQVFLGLDIGTATPTLEECGEIEYTGVNLIDFNTQFDASKFMKYADAEIKRHQSAGLCSIVAGGTGLYVKALLEGLFPGPESDPKVREEINHRVECEGAFALHRELSEIDPKAAARIHHNDAMRIVRALEIYRMTGRRISDLQREYYRPIPRWPFYFFVLERPRDELYARIDLRVERMIQAGWLDEVRSLSKDGFSLDSPGAKALGYATLLRQLNGEISIDDAIRLIQRDSRRYAKRQLTWCRGRLEAHWVKMDEVHSARDTAQYMADWMDNNACVDRWPAGSHLD